MARANLVVTEELRSAFVGATKEKPLVRWIKAEVDDVRVKVTGRGTLGSDVDADLERMKQEAGLGATPCFLLFCVNPQEEKFSWLLISYVPEKSKVRARMLYASGVEDVRQALGHANFIGNVHVTDAREIESVAAMVGGVRRDHENAPLTEEELLAKEEIAQMASPENAKANAMGMVPFEFDKDFLDELQRFKDGECAVVEALIGSKEHIKLGDKGKSSLSSESVSQSEPRFYLTRLASGNVFFVFSCPENTPVKKRMVFSSAKLTVLDRVDKMGIQVLKTLEFIGDISDVTERLREVDEDVTNPNAGKIVQQAFSKPSRPGRGQARIIKK